MKIIQVVQKPQLRGAEIFAAQLSTHLQQAGHEVMLISLFHGDASLPFTGRQIHLMRLLSKRMWDLDGWRQLAQLIKEFQPDIIQANAGDTLKFLVASKKIFRWQTPIVFRNANTMSDFIDSKPKYFFNRYLLKSTAHIASVSDKCSADVIHLFSLNQAYVATIEIGIDFREIGVVPIDLRPIFSRGPVYLNVASLVPEKNHAGLLRIFAAIRESLPDAQLIIIGKGKLDESLRKISMQLGLAAEVHFLGYRNDILEVMSGSQAFLLPSLIEGLPAVILEAMWAKCPVVSYDVGGIGEVIVDRVTGLLTTKGDEVTFAHRVLSLQHPSSRNKIIKAAYQLVSDKFDNREIALRFAKIYTELIKKRARK